MAKKTFLAAFYLLLMVALLACGGSEQGVDTQATQIAAGVAATLAAQAPPPQTVIFVTPTAEQAAGIDLMNIRLAADGSGDLATLKDALVQSKVGATISLGPGTYRLDEALTVGGSLHLAGAGMDRTEIISNVPDWVLRFQGDGPFTAVGITFRYDGSDAADVVAVAGGEISFAQCRFAGGVWTEETGIGSGLFLEGSVTGEIRDCEATENGLHGILVRDDASPLLENNTFHDNDDTGIAYFDRGGGTARSNDCSGNTVHGIYVDDQAAPNLEGNTLRNNGDSGIAYFGSAAGLAQKNSCAGNVLNGIYVGEDAAPALMENDCPLGGTAEPPSRPGATEGRIAFASDRDGNLEIYTMNADGSEWTRLTNNEAADYAPAWSPDGKRIAFLSTRDGNTQVYVMNADGSEQTRLTESLISESTPSWSPDGLQLAFTSYTGGGGNDIYVMNVTDRMDASGNGATRLTTDLASDGDAAWSPDGTRIAFISDRTGDYDVNVMNADGSEQTPITRIDGWKYSLQWSPDGRRMLFVFNEAVHAISADGTNLSRVTGAVDDASRAAWAPDATRVVYQSGNDLWVSNVDGTGAVRLTNDSGTERDPSWWSPSPAPIAPQSPRFNPGGEPWCFHMPEFVVGGDWQVVAPRDVVFPGDLAEIGLRNNAEQAGTEYPITVRIITPDESEATATGTLTADQWVHFVYPDDFPGGSTSQRGAYTILWEIEGNLITCDGFLVGGGASQ
jgi:parallel beta-helix repeat protein